MADWLTQAEDFAREASAPASNNGYAWAERAFGTVRVRFTKFTGRLRYFANHLEMSRADILRLDAQFPAVQA